MLTMTLSVRIVFSCSRVCVSVLVLTEFCVTTTESKTWWDEMRWLCDNERSDESSFLFLFVWLKKSWQGERFRAEKGGKNLALSYPFVCVWNILRLSFFPRKKKVAIFVLVFSSPRYSHKKVVWERKLVLMSTTNKNGTERTFRRFQSLSHTRTHRDTFPRRRFVRRSYRGCSLLVPHQGLVGVCESISGALCALRVDENVVSRVFRTRPPLFQTTVRSGWQYIRRWWRPGNRVSWYDFIDIIQTYW